MIFDEQSSWWSPENKVLPDSDQLKNDLRNSKIALDFTDNEVEVEQGSLDQHNEPQNDAKSEPSNQNQPTLKRSQRVSKPNPKYANVAIVEDVLAEPSSFEEASVKEEWWQAMKAEMAALQSNETWELVPKPQEVKPVTCKWVYKLKQRTDGTIDRFKARLVARGFSQEYGVNYEDTFSPVVKLTTVRVLLAIAMSKQWDMWQMDVNNAFLYG